MSRSDFHLFIEENGTWLITFFGVLGGCFSGMTIYFLKSRCRHIKLCWGLVDCDREPLPASQIEISTEERV